MNSDKSHCFIIWHKKIKVLLSIIAISLTALAIFLTYIYNLPFEAEIKIFVVAFWAIGPPVFFAIEWMFVNQVVKDLDWEKFRYSQDLAKNIWLAILSVLFFLWFKEIPSIPGT